MCVCVCVNICKSLLQCMAWKSVHFQLFYVFDLPKGYIVSCSRDIFNTSSQLWSHYTPRKQFLWIKETFVWYTVKEKISLNWRKFCWLKKISLIYTNQFLWIKEIFFELTNLSLIQRIFFFDRISKECFFDSKKLLSQCTEVLFFSEYIESEKYLVNTTKI